MIDIQPNDFKYTLYCKGKEWVLPQAPDGWEESTLQWARSLEYFGLLRTFSVPLRFVLDGAWLLRRVMYTEGIEGDAILKIELLNRISWQYETLYEGDVDFSTFEDTMDAVESKLMEMGISASVAAFSNVEYEWPVLPEDTVQVRLPGIDRIENAAQSFFGALTRGFGIMPEVNITSNDILSNAVTVRSVPFNDGWNGDPDYAFLRGGSSNQSVRIWGQLEFTFMPSNPNNYYLIRFGDNLSTIGTNLFIIADTRNYPPGTHVIDFDFNYNIVADRNYFISVIRLEANISEAPSLSIDFGQLQISVEFTTPASVVRAFKPKRIFQMLIDRMHDEEVEAQSALLDQWDNLLITSGDAIRTIMGATLKTNFKDFFKSINAVLGAGFGIIDYKPVLEKKSFFFRPGLMALDLGDSVKDVSIRPADEFMFNSIKAGYPNDDYDVDQGREEFNSGQIWSTNIVRLQKQLDLSSAYRADQYGIEQLRITIMNNDRENVNEVDKKNDNEVFFIHAQKTPGNDGIYNVIGAEAYSEITGISARSSSYNLGISPKNNLLRHADYLAAAMYNNGSYIFFESSDKNADLSTTTLEGNTVQERGIIPISDLGEPLFLPFKVDLTTDLQFDAWKLLQNNNSGYIRFVWREFEFYGYVLEVSQNIERNSERTISILLTQNSDITKLIF